MFFEWNLITVHGLETDRINPFLFNVEVLHIYINAYECGPVVWRRFGDPLRKGSHEWQVLQKLQTDEPESTVFAE